MPSIFAEVSWFPSHKVFGPLSLASLSPFRLLSFIGRVVFSPSFRAFEGHRRFQAIRVIYNERRILTFVSWFRFLLTIFVLILSSVCCRARRNAAEHDNFVKVPNLRLLLKHKVLGLSNVVLRFFDRLRPDIYSGKVTNFLPLAISQQTLRSKLFVCLLFASLHFLLKFGYGDAKFFCSYFF